MAEIDFFKFKLQLDNPFKGYLQKCEKLVKLAIIIECKLVFGFLISATFIYYMLIVYSFLIVKDFNLKNFNTQVHRSIHWHIIIEIIATKSGFENRFLEYIYIFAFILIIMS